jgi:hypothetical protein
MNKQLMDIVLPSLARRLHRQLERYRAGELDDSQFNRRFEAVLEKQYGWLAKQGVSEAEAAIAVHAAVLVLSGPGMRAEAAEVGLPLEVIEHRAIRTVADEIAENYEVDQARVMSKITAIMAQYAE